MIASDWDMNMLGKENIHKKNDKAWCASIKSRFKLLNPIIMPDAPVEDIAAYAASEGLYQVQGVSGGPGIDELFNGDSEEGEK
jgi:hypothetical protein